jgi:hypothetical protein
MCSPSPGSACHDLCIFELAKEVVDDSRCSLDAHVDVLLCGVIGRGEDDMITASDTFLEVAIGTSSARIKIYTILIGQSCLLVNYVYSTLLQRHTFLVKTCRNFIRQFEGLLGALILHKFQLKR